MASCSGPADRKITLDILFPETSSIMQPSIHSSTFWYQHSQNQNGKCGLSLANLAKPQGHGERVKKGPHSTSQKNETHLWNFTRLERLPLYRRQNSKNIPGDTYTQILSQTLVGVAMKGFCRNNWSSNSIDQGYRDNLGEPDPIR